MQIFTFEHEEPKVKKLNHDRIIKLSKSDPVNRREDNA